MRLVTANVNGIRAALRRGGLEWLAAADADIIALQEIRADDGILAAALTAGGLSDYHVRHDAGDDPGRAGVAVLTRAAPTAVRTGVGTGEAGRWIEVDIALAGGPLTVASCYVHTGEAQTPRQDVKYRFLDAMAERMTALADKAAAGGPEAVVAGDLNVAHSAADIKNWKGNRDRAGFLPRERAYLDRWLEGDWVDLGRAHGGPGPGPYTWWSWRGKAFDNDAGWRIDYVLATRDLAARVQRVTVGRAPTYAQRWSDHAPVVVDVADR